MEKIVICYWYRNYQIIAKDSEIVATPLCLENISKYVFKYNMKKTVFYEYV